MTTNSIMTTLDFQYAVYTITHNCVLLRWWSHVIRLAICYSVTTPSKLHDYPSTSAINLTDIDKIDRCVTRIKRNKAQDGSIINQSHKSLNAPVPYPTVHHAELKCAHFCSEWCIVGYETGALWDLWIRSVRGTYRILSEALVLRIRRLIVRSRKVSKPRDLYFELSDHDILG